jgi:hypothetical protein
LATPSFWWSSSRLGVFCSFPQKMWEPPPPPLMPACGKLICSRNEVASQPTPPPGGTCFWGNLGREFTV